MASSSSSPSNRLLYYYFFLFLFFLTTLSSAQPSQYCRLGQSTNSGDDVDFCIAVSLYHNHSSSAHDVYLTMSLRRSAASHESRSLGWTAVGIGSRMQGALMFVMYGGDPDTPDAAGGTPTLSLRTVQSGHSKPEPIPQQQQQQQLRTRDERFAVQVSKSGWSKADDGSQYTAEASIVCYACSEWSGGASISTETFSQPWIWAWNKDQDMTPYSHDVPLQAHSMAGGSGYGTFYVDMKSAASHHADGWPAIHVSNSGEHANNIGTSDRPMDEPSQGLWAYLRSRPLAHLHGFFMTLAFIFLFPIGAVAIRSGLSNSFKYHWVLQVSATLSALTGAVIAIIMSDRVFGSPHQIAGFVIVSLLIIQGLLGWRHHMDYLRIQRRTWISYGHMTLGFVLLLAGWANVLSGLVLYGLGKLGIALMVLVVLLEAVGVGGWSYMARRRAKSQSLAFKETQDASAAYFALEDIPESDEEDDDEVAGGKPEEERGLMRK